MRRIQIQTRTSQLLITHINQGTNHMVSHSPILPFPLLFCSVRDVRSPTCKDSQLAITKFAEAIIESVPLPCTMSFLKCHAHQNRSKICALVVLFTKPRRRISQSGPQWRNCSSSGKDHVACNSCLSTHALVHLITTWCPSSSSAPHI
jgi:hypothetical protein